MKTKYETSPWKGALYKLFDSEEFNTAIFQLLSDVEAKQMFTPALKNLFKNLELCTPKGVNVVFINQYPFEQKGVADGLAFSTGLKEFPEGMPTIIKNFNTALYGTVKREVVNYDLSHLVKQGVLLWNTALTCPIGKQADHYPMWEPITRLFLQMLSKNIKGLVYVFIGPKSELLTDAIHDGNFKIFLPSVTADKNWNYADCFNGINEILKAQKKHPIKW